MFLFWLIYFIELIQLIKILQLIGFPSKTYLCRLTPDIQKIVRSLRDRITTDKPFNIYLEQKLATKPDKNQLFKSDALDLILKMLCIDPKERISCDDMISHDFFGIHKDSDDQKRNYSIFKMDNLSDISLSDLKGIFYD